jgi:iron(III) transport system permease protein
VAALFAAPLLYLVIRNLQEGQLGETLGDDGLLGPLGRTLLLASTVTTACVVLGTGAAWLVTRTDLVGRRIFRVLLPLPLVIPSFIGAFTLIAAFAPGGLAERAVGAGGLIEVRGFTGAFFVLTLLTYPYVYLPAAARLRHLPRSAEESARLLGRGAWATFREVVLPQAWSAVAAGALLCFLYVIADFGAVQLLRYETLTRAIYANRLLDPGASVAMSLVLGVLAIAIVIAERRVSRRGRDLRREGRPLIVALGRWQAAAVGGVTALLLLALAAPLGVLTYWAVRGLDEGSSRSSSVVSDPSQLIEPSIDTAMVSVTAAVVAVAVILPVALLAGRRRSGVGAGAASVVVGGFALPGLVVALSLAYWTLQTPGPLAALYQTLPLLIAAYVLHFGALALGPTQVAAAGVPDRMHDAARTLGRGRLRRLISIDLPLMAPGLIAGAGLVMLSVMKELPATLLLRPNGFETLAIRIWSSTGEGFYTRASAAGLALLAVSIVPLLVMTHRDLSP